MFKTLLILTCCLLLSGPTWAQTNPSDTTPSPVVNAATVATDSSALDEDMDIDALLNDLDLFLDSILAPRSYVLLNLSMTQGYFNFTSKNNLRNRETKKSVWSPLVGYYDKSGVGITVASYAIYDSARQYFYQAAFTPSYDYLQNRKLATGISYTRYFTRNSVPFYTSPLQNELNGYFLWRKSWLQPGVAANYGWGSHTEFHKREETLKKALTDAADAGTIRIASSDTISIIKRILARNSQSIVDFSLMFSVRHDFYWLQVFSKKDYIRFSPMLTASAGTQKFGFNNESTTAFSNIRTAVFYTSRSVSLRQKFQLLSSTLYLRGEYFIGKFFIQPQLLFDYYFPKKNSGFTTLFSLNTGFLF